MTKPVTMHLPKRAPVIGTYRLAALDVDGTLLNRKGEVSPRTKAALHGLAARGVPVVLATGRRWIIARTLPALLEIPLYLILSNGAIIRDHTGKLLYERYLPAAWAWQAVEAARAVGLQATIYENARAGDHILIDGDYRQNKNAQAAIKRRPELESLYVDLNTITDLPDPIQVVLWGPAEPLQEVQRRLESTGWPYTFVFWQGGASSSFVTEQCALEILGPQVSKATALEWLCTTLGIAPAQVVAFGDDVNDVEMLQFAGLGVAVGNATPAALAAADLHTDDHESDGVASILEHLFLA